MATASSCELEVVSLLKVTDLSFLTPEEEDVRYGPFDEIHEEAVREIAASKGDVVFQAPVGEVYLELFWDGWQAAYLSSKRENASKGVVSDFRNVKTTQQCAGRKRKFGETLSDEERGEMFQEPMDDMERIFYAHQTRMEHRKFHRKLILVDKYPSHYFLPYDLHGKRLDDAIEKGKFIHREIWITEFYRQLLLA